MLSELWSVCLSCLSKLDFCFALLPLSMNHSLSVCLSEQCCSTSVKTLQTEREQRATSCTEQHTTTSQTLNWDWDWMWTRPDQARSTQPVRTGCCSKKGTIKRKRTEETLHTHTSSKRARGDTTIESKNTAVHVPCSSVYE